MALVEWTAVIHEFGIVLHCMFVNILLVQRCLCDPFVLLGNAFIHIFFLLLLDDVCSVYVKCHNLDACSSWLSPNHHNSITQNKIKKTIYKYIPFGPALINIVQVPEQQNEGEFKKERRINSFPYLAEHFGAACSFV